MTICGIKESREIRSKNKNTFGSQDIALDEFTGHKRVIKVSKQRQEEINKEVYKYCKKCGEYLENRASRVFGICPLCDML